MKNPFKTHLKFLATSLFVVFIFWLINCLFDLCSMFLWIRITFIVYFNCMIDFGLSDIVELGFNFVTVILWFKDYLTKNLIKVK